MGPRWDVLRRLLGRQEVDIQGCGEHSFTDNSQLLVGGPIDIKVFRRPTTLRILVKEMDAVQSKEDTGRGCNNGSKIFGQKRIPWSSAEEPPAAIKIR